LELDRLEERQQVAVKTSRNDKKVRVLDDVQSLIKNFRLDK